MTISVSDLIVELQAANLVCQTDITACDELLCFDTLSPADKLVIQNILEEANERATALVNAINTCQVLVASGYPASTLSPLTTELINDLTSDINDMNTSVTDLITRLTPP